MGEEKRRRNAKIPIVPLAAIVVTASAIGIGLGLLIDWFPAQGATQSDKIDTFWDVLLVFSVPVFVLVTTIVLFSVYQFRQRPGEEGLDGPPIHGNTQIEIVWTAIPAAILVGLCAYAYVVLHDIEKAPAKGAPAELNVEVTGQQFAWTFKYHENGKDFNTTRLYLPQNRSVRFHVKSVDVLHDFWVPAFRMKIDAVPGITTKYRVTPKRLGSYPIVCAELCGLGHAYMRQTAYVYTPAKWAAWVKKMTGAAAPAAAAPTTAGKPAAATVDAKALFTKGNQNGATACGACHQLADAGTPAGGIGPDLDKALAAQDEAFVKESIVDPGKVIAKGFPPGVMPPNYKDVLSPAELDALVKYVYSSTHK